MTSDLTSALDWFVNVYALYKSTYTLLRPTLKILYFTRKPRERLEAVMDSVDVSMCIVYVDHGGIEDVSSLWEKKSFASYNAFPVNFIVLSHKSAYRHKPAFADVITYQLYSIFPPMIGH